MNKQIEQLARSQGADIVGFASSKSFDKDDAIFKIFPQTKTIIALGFRILRGIYRGIEEGSTYYQYTTMAVENMEETIMPTASIRVSVFLEQNGYIAVPQRKHQTIMSEPSSTNPEVAYNSIYRNIEDEVQMDFLDSAVKCGLGEKSLHGALLTEDFGPMVRYCFVLTDAELTPTEQKNFDLCDNCGKCIKACPGGAIDKSGKVDPWQCATYYIGANGTKNPFMPYDAYSDLNNRIDIISGKARVTPELAKEIIDNTFFYPPAMHSYPCSICGRACDIECYIHLEQKGALNKTFKTPFRKRTPFEFGIEGFE